MPGTEDSLFSLELVVDKLYIPHVQCRFPAVAFRLIDFPTIVINHVEAELGKAIRRQISFDPDYEMPEQFCELKDKHGNFMVKKGKSCLFKMVAETLKNHLANTPLYVMVIDMFPETPKLVGNSTVPLNVLIDAICADLVRVGPTVPSVHGDKGLFKIYNLMGKEIGYFVLGFRLLCLGPSLIPHLPEAALVQRQSKKHIAQQKRQNKQLVEMVQLSQDEGQGEEEEGDLVETRTWGSMTEPVKHDVMMQTVEMDHKGVHVDIQNPSVEAQVVTAVNVQPLSQQQRNTHHSGTQTNKKGIKTAFNAKQKVLEDLAGLEKDEDEVIINNIVCPPPLFFNCDAKPHIEVDDDSYSLDTEMSVSEEVSAESITDEEADAETGLVKPKPKETIVIDKGQITAPPPPVSFQNVSMNVKFNVPQNISPQQARFARNLPAQFRGAGFPLLTALMNELMCIQSPNMEQMQGLGLEFAPSTSRGQRLPTERLADRQAVVREGAAKDLKKVDEMNKNIADAQKETVDEKDVFGRHRIGHHECAHAPQAVPKDKSWLRVVHPKGPKKSKLNFGLTNTQRLRLQKTNPQWLKNMEREELSSKVGKRDISHRHDSGDELNVSMSDTLTEVRRQAQKELEKTAAEDTLASSFRSATALNASKRGRSKSKGRGRGQRQHSRSDSKEKAVNRALKPGVKTPHTDRSRRSDDTHRAAKARPHSVDPSVKNILSPDPGGVPPFAAGDLDDDMVPMSARSVDQPSSARSRSIEVRMPSVQTSHDDASEATISDTDEDEEDVPLPDESYSKNGSKHPVSFPAYLKRSESLPESIQGQPNQSLYTTDLDDDSPLESTRNYHPGARESRNMSTDDQDTKQTFHSTSEPELQGLNESLDEEDQLQVVGKRAAAMKFPVVNPVMSENSPVPSTRRSVAMLDLSRSQMPATPRADTTTPRSSRSGSMSPKRPTPRPRPHRPTLRDLHTESISSYQPSDPENPMGSFDSSGEGNYSDDFAEELVNLRSDRPRLIPSSKLGYTIH